MAISQVEKEFAGLGPRLPESDHNPQNFRLGQSELGNPSLRNDGHFSKRC